MFDVRMVPENWEHPVNQETNKPKILYPRCMKNKFIAAGIACPEDDMFMLVWNWKQANRLMLYKDNIPYIDTKFKDREALAKYLADNYIPELSSRPEPYDRWLFAIYPWTNNELKIIDDYPLDKTLYDNYMTYMNDAQLVLERRTDNFPYGERGTYVTVDYYLLTYRVKHAISSDGEYVILDTNSEYYPVDHDSIYRAKQAYSTRYEGDPCEIVDKSATIMKLILSAIDQKISDRTRRIHIDCMNV